MVASFNPKLQSTTFLSIPRDLYVKKPNDEYGKINGVFTTAFGMNKRDVNLAALELVKKKSLRSILQQPRL